MYYKLHDRLLSEVSNRKPKGIKLSEELSHTLSMGKEAVYRRLRGDVHFSIEEVANICLNYGISMDEIINTTSGDVCNLKLYYTDGEHTGIVARFLDGFISALDTMKDSPEAIVTYSCNQLPETLVAKYDTLSAFFLFKRFQMLQADGRPVCLDDTEAPEHIRSGQKEVHFKSRRIAKSVYLFNTNILRNLANDIRFFSDIEMISAEVISRMRAELSLLLDELEQMADTGRYEDGERVEIYISQMNYESNYTYCEAPGYNHCFMDAFGVSNLSSHDSRSSGMIKKWLYAIKRGSVLISESGQKPRRDFFQQQRQIIEEL